MGTESWWRRKNVYGGEGIRYFNYKMDIYKCKKKKFNVLFNFFHTYETLYIQLYYNRKTYQIYNLFILLINMKKVKFFKIKYQWNFKLFHIVISRYFIYLLK